MFFDHPETESFNSVITAWHQNRARDRFDPEHNRAMWPLR